MDTGYTPDLEIPEAKLVPATRRIKGVVRNVSSKVYVNVEISYHVRGPMAIEAGEVVTTIPKLAPHESAPFETPVISPNGVEFVLREITGHAQ
jgi:hypothetical protein